MTLQFSQGAEEKAAAAVRWYNDQRDDLGDEFLDALQQMLAAIESTPRLYSKISGVNAHRELRHAVMRRFPYRIVFEVKCDLSLVVLAVAHVRRHPDYWHQRTDE